MSASRERKKRQEFAASGATDPKAAREAEKRARERKGNILYAVIGVVFVAVAAFLLVYNSGILQRNVTAVTIDGVDYSAADYSYYYNLIYQKYYQSYGSYTDMLVSADQIQSEALQQMKFVQAALAKAQEEGFTLDEEGQETIQTNIDTAKSRAQANGLSYASYIKQTYGSLVTKSVFEENLKNGVTASLYAQAYQDSLAYTDSDIDAEYEASPNDYDMVDYTYISIDASAETTTDDEGNTVDPTEEETATAWEDGKALADELLAAWESGEDMSALVEEDERATLTSSTEVTYSSSAYVDWCFEDGREIGEIGMVEDETNGRIYLVQFEGRYRDERQSVNVRHILVTEASLDEGVEATQENLEAKAQEILDTWDGTEDGFAALANEYSQDTGSNTNGGLYENVLPGQMVTSFNDWCFDESRKAGDTGIVYNDGSYTGAHIMYYVGTGDQVAWKETVRTALVNEAMSTWETELLDTIESAELQDGAKYVG